MHECVCGEGKTLLNTRMVDFCSAYSAMRMQR